MIGRAIAALILLSSLARADVVDAVAQSRQLILVLADREDSSTGVLTINNRVAAATWERVGEQAPVMLGRSGVAWGIGLHPQPATKREGDLRAPLGVFELENIYGVASSPPSQFPYQQLTETTEGIDDPRSRYYNRIIDVAAATRRDWRSSEKLSPANPMYRWLINVKHNWAQRPGFGSNIYLHIWKAPGVGTHGCTAMSAATLDRIVHWLDASKRPLHVQLTRDDYARLRDAWHLP